MKIIKRRLLTKEEEIKLSKRKDKGEIIARNKLIENNIRLVISIAKKYSKYGMELNDLISEGMLGLIHGIDKFDWKKGYKVSTYTTYWIHQAILKYINSNDLVKISLNTKKLQKKMEEIKNSYLTLFGENMSEPDLFQNLKVSPKRIKKFKVQENYSISNIEDLEIVSGSSELESFNKINKDEIIKTIENAIEILPDKERKIFNLRCEKIS